jgi:hypothetical protein
MEVTSANYVPVESRGVEEAAILQELAACLGIEQHPVQREVIGRCADMGS